MQNNSPRILITRLSHIGDCILTLPMVRAIKAQYPQAYIAWVVESPTHKLLAHVSEIDELVLVPKSWMSKPKNWFQLRSKLRALRFDYVIDPQGITKSAMLGKLSGARTRIGIQGKWGRELSPRLNNFLVSTERTHLVDRSLELLVALGITSPKVEGQLPVQSEDLRAMQAAMRKLNGGPFVLVNPGASWASKRWVDERFGAVSKFVFERYGLRSCVSWAGKDEQAMAETVVQNSSNSAFMAPPTTLGELAALCQLSTFFIGCDTGPMHIAAAVGAPVLGLYGPTKPQDSGAYGKRHVHVQKWYQSGTSRERRTAENLAMSDISVKDVCEAVDTMCAGIESTKLVAA